MGAIEKIGNLIRLGNASRGKESRLDNGGYRKEPSRHERVVGHTPEGHAIFNQPLRGGLDEWQLAEIRRTQLEDSR